MSYFRQVVSDQGLNRVMRQGDGILNPSISVIATDANAVLSAAQVAGGVIQFTGFTAGRNLTTDTAANYLLQFPEMDIGDSLQLLISIITAFAGTFVAGTDITLAGRTTVPANSTVQCYLTRTGAATFTLRAL